MSENRDGGIFLTHTVYTFCGMTKHCTATMRTAHTTRTALLVDTNAG